MGTGASVATTLQAEIDQLKERELNLKDENVKEWDKQETKLTSRLSQLDTERKKLAARLADVEASLEHQREGWRKEKEKTVALTYGNLPLWLLSEEDLALLERKSTLPITKKFPMVTVAQCDVVGFSLLVERLKPREMIRVVDHLHALIDEAYHGEDVFIMERSSDGCIAVAGLAETLLEERHLREDSLSSLSLADSSYGSENYLLDFDKKPPKNPRKPRDADHEQHTDKHDSKNQLKMASYFAGQLATAVLNLMSSSSKIHIPLIGRKQLQLRIALHSGPCSAGVLGLQSSLGTNRAPQFKLFGTTVRHAESLCRTGLALQIRVSKRCKDLLSYSDKFLFERCPDFPTWDNRKPIESYWMVGKSTSPVTLPSLDLAISLSDYEDTDV